MQTFLRRCTAVGIVLGGFALTGDLHWLAARGLQVLNSRTVPAEEAPAVPETTAAAPIDPSGTTAARQADMPEIRPPVGGPESADIRTLPAGGRLIVWVGGPRPDDPGLASRCLVCDIVDPAGGEALVYEVAAFAADGRPLATASPPRRLMVAGLQTEGFRLTVAPANSQVARGGTLLLRHPHEPTQPDERIGPIVALDVH